MSDWSSDVCSSDLWADEASVEESYAGQAVAVAADPTAIRAEERPWDETAKRHWFWSEVRRMRRSFYPVLGAALMINLLGFALPLFTMNVYDRVIPNKAVSSLWVLAIGALLAFSSEELRVGKGGGRTCRSR